MIENLLNEQWKDIKNYEGFYQVSNYGRVKSLKREYCKQDRLLRLLNGPKGYKLVRLCKSPDQTTLRVPRLVAQAFIPNPNNLPCVNHINCVVSDNRVENLEWCTYAQNTQYSFKLGRSKRYGIYNGRAKLNDEKVREIRNLYKLGGISHIKIAKMLKMSNSAVFSALKGDHWKHVN